MGVSFDEKATITRQRSVVNALGKIQQELVAFKVNGFHLDLPLDPVMAAMKELDRTIDDFMEANAPKEPIEVPTQDAVLN